MPGRRGARARSVGAWSAPVGCLDQLAVVVDRAASLKMAKIRGRWGRAAGTVLSWRSGVWVHHIGMPGVWFGGWWSLEGSGGAGRPAGAMTTSPTVSRGPRAGRRSQRDEPKTLRAECVSGRDQLKKVSAGRDRLRTDCERFGAELEVAGRRRSSRPCRSRRARRSLSGPVGDASRVRHTPRRGVACDLRPKRSMSGSTSAYPMRARHVVGSGLRQHPAGVPRRADRPRCCVAASTWTSGIARGCPRPVRGRHREQTSDALDTGRCVLGGWVLVFAAWGKVGCELPASKVAKAASAAGGISVTPWRPDPGHRGSGNRRRGRLRRAHRRPASIESGLC